MTATNQLTFGSFLYGIFIACIVIKIIIPFAWCFLSILLDMTFQVVQFPWYISIPWILVMCFALMRK